MVMALVSEKGPFLTHATIGMGIWDSRLRFTSGGPLSAATPILFDLEETILINGGKYTARSYRVQGYMALWLVSVGIVQFYDAEGNMLATVNLFKELEPLKMAA